MRHTTHLPLLEGLEELSLLELMHREEGLLQEQPRVPG